MNRNDQQFVAQNIRTQYMEKAPSELDALRALDKKVKRPANIFAYVFGGIAALIMGSGMSLVMTDIAEKLSFGFDPMIPGIVVDVVGMAMALVTYPIYKRILNKRKTKFAPEIMAISDSIIGK